MCIQTGLIVWINGPFVAGKYNNITIFQSKMIYELLDWEMVEADQGYVGQPNKIHMKNELGVCENQFEAKPRARARGETINGRFKNFHILMDRYRHKISMHSHVFCAVAVLTQISLTTVSPTFKVNYPTCNNFTRMSFHTLILPLYHV